MDCAISIKLTTLLTITSCATSLGCASTDEQQSSSDGSANNTSVAHVAEPAAKLSVSNDANVIFDIFVDVSMDNNDQLMMEHALTSTQNGEARAWSIQILDSRFRLCHSRHGELKSGCVAAFKSTSRAPSSPNNSARSALPGCRRTKAG